VSVPGWQWTILAPDATVSNNSKIDGAVIANSFSGGGEIDDFAYQGTIPCFTDGTLIRTVSGDVAVEDLAMGDHVVTASGTPDRFAGWGIVLSLARGTQIPVSSGQSASVPARSPTPVRDLWSALDIRS
jgi:hypothetical protein